MKKIIIGIFIVALAACSDRVESPMELVKKTTIDDTREYCMKLHKNKKYCECEVVDLEKNFPWDDYIAAVDALAGEPDHIGKVIAKHNGNRKKILEELNCPTCYFAMALVVAQVGPSPRCAELLR